MKRWVTIVALLGSLCASAQTERTRVLDLTADVLPPGQGELGLLFLRYGRGVLPGLQLSSQLGLVLTGTASLEAKYQLVRDPHFRMALQVGGSWWVAARYLPERLPAGLAVPHVFVPVWLRTTAAIGPAWELSASAGLTTIVLGRGRADLLRSDLSAELSLIHYDDAGAWLLTGTAPISSWYRTQVNLEGIPSPVSGTVQFDSLDAWSLVVGRDFAFGPTAHFRAGVGYRNRPGLFLVDSFDGLIVKLDLYWR